MTDEALIIEQSEPQERPGDAGAAESAAERAQAAARTERDIEVLYPDAEKAGDAPDAEASKAAPDDNRDTGELGVISSDAEVNPDDLGPVEAEGTAGDDISWSTDEVSLISGTRQAADVLASDIAATARLLGIDQQQFAGLGFDQQVSAVIGMLDRIASMDSAAAGGGDKQRGVAFKMQAKDAASEFRTRHSAVMNGAEQIQSRGQQKMSARQTQRLKAEANKLKAAAPDFDGHAVGRYLREMGYSDEQIAGINDHRVLLTVWKAMQADGSIKPANKIIPKRKGGENGKLYPAERFPEAAKFGYDPEKDGPPDGSARASAVQRVAFRDINKRTYSESPTAAATVPPKEKTAAELLYGKSRRDNRGRFRAA